jgi:outer membrane protein OmpA-like peptidoglycan-associated protein
MKKIVLGLVMAMSLMGCRAQVRVQAKAETPPPEPPKTEAPAPEPEPQAGEQIVLPDQIEFDTDKARIKQTPKTLETLSSLADMMKKHSHVTKLRIEGHTDNIGSDDHNEKLSKARADAVAKWLSQHEVAENRLVTVGHGAKRPVKPNDSKVNRAQNRRTEYYVEELDGKKVTDDGKKFESKPDPKVATTTTSSSKAKN